MRSTVRHLIDYRAAPMEWKVSLRCPEEHLKKELRQIVRRYKQVTEAPALIAGDVAILKLESDFPKFQKAAVPVTIGSGLFHQELEQQCIGHGPGDCFRAQTEHGTVTVTVLKASRTQYPEPTDEMVARFGEHSETYAGITTVADFLEKARKDWQQEARVNAVYEKMDQLMGAVLTTSDWDFDEEDLRWLRKQNLSQLQQEVGKPLETLTSEELIHQFGVSDMEGLIREIDVGSERWIASILWCAAVAGRTPSFEDMESLDFSFLEDFVRTQIVYEEEEI